MQALFVITPLVLLLFLLARMARKNSRKSESKLSVLEHPSTFTRPSIEWVTDSAEDVADGNQGLRMEIDPSQEKHDDNY